MELTNLGTESAKLPIGWKPLGFDDVFKKINAKFYQIQTSDYRETGLFPVIDQGKSLIVGYTDRGDKLLACPRGGLVVFGDHTRIVKFADFDFVVGADGTQVLSVPGANVARFFYYALLTQDVPNTGYNRHFKFLKEMSFSTPDPDEQRAIAAALGDVDALIAALDALIAKKRDIKQAAMQQLLTGKTRLPGFSGEWEVKRLGEVLIVRHGKSQKGVEASGGKYPILATGGEIGRTDSFLYDKPSVLIGRKGTIDAPQFVKTPFWTIDTLFFTEISRDANPQFIFYKFQTVDWRSYNEASGVPSLNASTIEKIELMCPPPAEQTAIATILADMDAELSALEAKRDKVRALKTGMMQELLTGRIRLI